MMIERALCLGNVGFICSHTLYIKDGDCSNQRDYKTNKCSAEGKENAVVGTRKIF